ncbi:F510_1955 family glycosylhydrolase [Alteribacter populi]|uniref:F510_1955 family glycosylhydrolase n=1 Tax=Alteribacter populi TaxID=2011011 RepID=UPI000BBA6462|nr:hypothetical protein [Alteribacter populi]
MKKRLVPLLVGVIGSVGIVGCSNDDVSETPGDSSNIDEKNEDEASVKLDSDDFFVENPDLEITHMHGLGYAGNDEILYIATHHGLAMFDGGTWYETAEEKNDYMGFNAVENGFYTSGHPGESSSFDVDPIGLVKSEDGGKTVESLDLLGVTDFHVKGAGYHTDAIYVYNPSPSDRLEETGLYFTLDDANTWEKSEGAGLPDVGYDQGGFPNYAIAVHPHDEAVVAIGTAEGLFLSEDYGDTFERSDLKSPVFSLTYDEEDLYVTTWNEEVTLVHYTEEGDINAIESPELGERDVIQYIAVNPQNRDEIAVTTVAGDGHISYDNGKTWNQIIKSGNVSTLE